ncbi:hypothetical protein ATN83_4223 [Raoultella ornithinolytica]|nr:hypothetical protein ATN83_4223 [Raoultella ornithinolytica]KDV95016.1 hypothetical protein AB00_0597 [Raoultella ornithinolytica 2-156-04_S1_C1]KDX15853.1 hypothetical protein AB28_0604 [Raoultella ornithinolytica 2-156-04_S1_C2]
MPQGAVHLQRRKKQRAETHVNGIFHRTHEPETPADMLKT